MSAAPGALRLIVGLGNPGAEYAQTRHNAGFWLVDALAAQQRLTLRLASKFNADLCRMTVANRELWLFKPLTYMNRSGQAVAAFSHFHKIPASEILVVHDDLDLPAGVVRLKQGGGHGGHNGLRDLIAQLGSNTFARLRIGIGHPGSSEQVLNHVLRRASSVEQELLNTAISDALSAMPRLLNGEWQRAVQALHSRPSIPSPSH